MSARIPLLLVALASLLTLARAQPPQTAPDSVEPLMNNLHFYGPLYPGDGSWNPHPMTLVADYTYQVNVTLDAGAFFLLVNMIAQTPDWKECKLGRGLDETKLEIGGGNIKVPQRGDYTLTYFTPSLLSSARPPMYAGAVPGGFLMAGRNLWPAVTIQTKDFVLQQQRVKLSLVFSSPIAVDAVLRNASAIKVEHADVDNITSVSSTQVDLYILPSELRSEFIIRVSIPEGLTYAETDDPDNPGTMLVGLPTTAAYFSLIYSPPWWRRGTAAWGRLVIMRDPTNRWPVGQPMDGWYVTAIHGNILARTGQVLLTGWGRAEEFACKSAGSRKLGVSFLLDPTDLLNLPKQSQSPSLTYSIAETLQENGRNNSDVLYCSGHAPLRDGRKFYAGGATYLNLGTATEEETGLPYARVWDPLQLNWTQVTADLPGGTSWYPTTTRLEDGRVLITGGFSSYTCPSGTDCMNPALAIFNLTAHDAGFRAVYDWYLPKEESDQRINPGGKDYTRAIVLPHPVIRGGYRRTIAMMGSAGSTLLVNLDPLTPYQQRFHAPPNGVRPTSGGCNSDSTAALVGTGEILSMGGCGSSWLDLYNPLTDTWRSIDTGVPRNTPSSLLLPDGTVLLINGENGSLDQSAATDLTTPAASSGDPRYPQIFDPFLMELSTYVEVEDEGPQNRPPFRGYHNMVALLKDARVLVSGGVHSRGDIGCEQPNMRVYEPPYLRPFVGSQTRPQWDTQQMLDDATVNAESISPVDVQFLDARVEPFFMRPNGTITVSYTGGPLWTNLTAGRAPAVLMALQAFTHAYDHNQRYVGLSYASREDLQTAAGSSSGTISFVLPQSPLALPGEYFLFLLSASGVPSSGLASRILAENEIAVTAYDYPLTPGGPIPPHRVPYQPTTAGDPSGIWTSRSIIIVSVLGSLGILFFCVLGVWWWRKERKNDRAQRAFDGGPEGGMDGVGLTYVGSTRKFSQL